MKETLVSLKDHIDLTSVPTSAGMGGSCTGDTCGQGVGT